MRYELIVTAYDVMDQVHVVVRATSQEEMLSDDHSWTLLVSESFAGTGESDQRKWVRDALMYAAEAL